MKFERIHIGDIIKEKVLERNFTYARFAKLIGLQRQNIQKTIFEKHSLDTDLLILASEVLNFNLFQYYFPNDDCNENNYNKREIKATLTIEFGKEKKDTVFNFVFGDNDVKILSK
jgi:transcriptional regulator with XRE-family HTH domain